MLTTDIAQNDKKQKKTNCGGYTHKQCSEQIAAYTQTPAAYCLVNTGRVAHIFVAITYFRAVGQKCMIAEQFKSHMQHTGWRKKTGPPSHCKYSEIP